MEKERKEQRSMPKFWVRVSAIYLAFTAGNVFWGMFKYWAAVVNIHGHCPYQRDKITLRNI